MKAITANRLTDGVVVYLDVDNGWTEQITDAARFDDDVAEARLHDASARTGEFADIYLIEIDAQGNPDGRAKIRETIRMTGPTVRRDLGKQAGG